MRLTTAEVRLELNHGIATFTGKALDCANEQARQTVSKKRAAEKLSGFSILVRPFA